MQETAFLCLAQESYLLYTESDKKNMKNRTNIIEQHLISLALSTFCQYLYMVGAHQQTSQLHQAVTYRLTVGFDIICN